MKKAVSILLVLLLVAAILPTGALAADVVLSPQNLRVDGKRIECEKYNIDGSNYFKLRDIALVLNGTGSQFSVNWDGEKKLISLVTGEAYEPDGRELDLSGGDKSATAVPSTATLLIDGVERSDLSAYNLDGNNFFKLRDLGDALGFKVSYDKPSNTAFIISRVLSYPEQWRIQEYYNSSNAGDWTHSVNTYDADGNPLGTLFESNDYREETAYRYDELGYVQEYTEGYSSGYGGEIYEYSSTTVYGYNLWGQLESVVTTTSDGYSSEEFYTYDDDGNCVKDDIHSGDYRTIKYYSYDDRGNIIKSVTEVNGEVYGIVEYSWDEDGNMLRCWSSGTDSLPGYSYEYEYADGLTVKAAYSSGDYGYVTVYTYDERGNLLRQETDSTDWDNFSEYTYDEEGRMLESVYYDGCDLFTHTYAYDAEGRLLRQESSSPDEDYVQEYTYDEEGNTLKETYTGSDYTTVSEYTYDPAESRRTKTTVTAYPAAAELVLGCEEMDLALLDVERIYYYFLPNNCVSESVSWSSSNRNVVDVDEYGNVFTVGVGTAVVTATSESGLTASCTVTVVKEKFSLSVSTVELSLNVGETVPLRCIVGVVGTWQSCTLTAYRGDESLISLGWGDWLNRDEVDLKVTGLAAGETTIKITQWNPETEDVYNTIIIHVTIKDSGSAPKG